MAMGTARVPRENGPRAPGPRRRGQIRPAPGPGPKGESPTPARAPRVAMGNAHGPGKAPGWPWAPARAPKTYKEKEVAMSKIWCVQWEGHWTRPMRVTIKEAVEPYWRCKGPGHTDPGSFAHVRAKTPRAALRKFFGRARGERLWRAIQELDNNAGTW